MSAQTVMTDSLIMYEDKITNICTTFNIFKNSARNDFSLKIHFITADCLVKGSRSVFNFLK